MMKWCYTVGVLLILIVVGAAPRAEETVSPSDAREPVRLTLDECLALGLDNNPEIGLSKAQADAAKGQLMQAKAKLYPTVKFSANAVRTNMLADLGGSGVVMYPTTVPTSGGVAAHVHQIPFPNLAFTQNREGDILGAKIEAQYALYTGGMIKNGVQIAKLNEDSAEEKIGQKRNELVSKISQAFYGVLLAQQMVKVVDDAYNTATAHLEQVKAFFNEGIVSDLDVTRTEAKIAEIRPMQIDARNGLWMARLGLNNYLNIDLDTPVEAVGSIEYDVHPLPLPEDLYQTALKNRAEMKVLDLQLEMAKRLVLIAKAGGYPTVGLFANYQWNKGQETPPNDTIWRGGYQAGVAVQLPLFDGFETQGKVVEAEANVRQVVEGKRALELGVRTQVQQSIIQLRSAEEKIKAQDANVKAAQKNHEAVTARYAAGLASNLEVMDAESALLRANTDRLKSVYDYNVAWVQLQAALGNLEGGTQ
jgi:outer membrane protein